MNKLLHFFFLSLLGVLFPSCGGYHFHDETSLAARYASISVPYVEGDIDGLLTAAIVNAFVRAGSFEFRPTGGALILKAKLIDCQDDHIGFRYDRKKDGEMRKSIIPTESRRTIYAEVIVEEAASKTIVLGPARLSASADFDHDFEYARDEVNVFSLGQLSDFNQATEAVRSPLNGILARKIVDYVTYSW